MSDTQSIDSIHSVKSIESICSDGCPVSPSSLYEQRALVYQTRKSQYDRKSITAITTYRYRKSCLLVGKGTLACPRNEVNIIESQQRKIKTEKIRNIQLSFQEIQHMPLEMISICL